MKFRISSLILVPILTVQAYTAAQTVVITDRGGSTLTNPTNSTAQELSGMTYLGGNSYRVVSDTIPTIYSLTINVNPNTGELASADFNELELLPLKDEAGVALNSVEQDLEGIIYDGSTIYVSNEEGAQISQHDVTTGNRLSLITPASHPQFSVFANTCCGDDRSLEALTRREGGTAVWTANEEALSVDGGLSNFTNGTVVRLQKFDSSFNPAGQWAYLTDPIPGAALLSMERSGVVDLLAMPAGQLLVMERSFSTAGWRIRLYEADLKNATDVSGLSGLIGETFNPAGKTLLWQQTFSFLSNRNIEGITLGPQLNNGERSIILVADNGNFASNEHYFHALSVAQVGDFNSDGVVDDIDIDLVRYAVINMTNDSQFDIDGIGNPNVPDDGDFIFLVNSMINTGLGDADLNQIVNFDDFVSLSNDFNQVNTLWSQGNFTLDNVTNFDDFVVLSNQFGQTFGWSTAVPLAPEPSITALLGMALLTYSRCQRRMHQSPLHPLQTLS